jgi:hypothetical protein
VTDNSAALQRAGRREGQAKRSRALAALQAMTEAGEAIGFPAVARRALLTEQGWEFQQFNR